MFTANIRDSYKSFWQESLACISRREFLFHFKITERDESKLRTHLVPRVNSSFKQNNSILRKKRTAVCEPLKRSSEKIKQVQTFVSRHNDVVENFTISIFHNLLYFALWSLILSTIFSYWISSAIDAQQQRIQFYSWILEQPDPETFVMNVTWTEEKCSCLNHAKATQTKWRNLV